MRENRILLWVYPGYLAVAGCGLKDFGKLVNVSTVVKKIHQNEGINKYENWK